MRIDYLIMARALLPPVDESSSKRRFSFRYTSIGMISHAVKTQGVCNIEERGERRRKLTDLAWYSGALYQGIFFHRWSQTQWLELFFIRHTLPPYPSFILRQRTSFIDLFRHLRSHPYSWQVSDLSSHGRRKHLSKAGGEIRLFGRCDAIDCCSTIGFSQDSVRSQWFIGRQASIHVSVCKVDLERAGYCQCIPRVYLDSAKGMYLYICLLIPRILEG